LIVEPALMPVMSARASLAVRRNYTAKPSKRGGQNGITAKEIKDVEELATPRTPVIYEVVRRLGEEEMERPVTSLWWSGVAAGLSISFSLLSQAILTAHLPQASWQPLVVSFGYSIGFIMAVLSRQQLFTESTITAVLPVAAEVTWGNIVRMARLWAIVLAANLAGTLFADCSHSRPCSQATWQRHAGDQPRSVELRLVGDGLPGDCRGFLMAAMVWLMPGAEGAQFHVITLMTWLTPSADSPHRRRHGILSSGIFGGWFAAMITEFMVPVLIGNMIGTTLFALIAYAGDGRDLGPSSLNLKKSANCSPQLQ
jgi:formate/nitrite transporter FocA (FNT family)